ncbi:hypothetical protein Q5P01_015652 [Channa striata]|uniref:Uncharacterized protein n=1 Tax=Channa striata TaxID=64152 RepID=A0AA88SKQ9_CHASR|nr:hypothetical protein Q5P01_015652 [Channa striata]
MRILFPFPALDVTLIWTAGDVQSDNRTTSLVIMTTVTSLQGLAQRRQRSSTQTAGVPRGCTPAEARRHTDGNRAGYRGRGGRAEGAEFGLLRPAPAAAAAPRTG